jgi:hypothetical protein
MDDDELPVGRVMILMLLIVFLATTLLATCSLWR